MSKQLNIRIKDEVAEILAVQDNKTKFIEDLILGSVQESKLDLISRKLDILLDNKPEGITVTSGTTTQPQFANKAEMLQAIVDNASKSAELLEVEPEEVPLYSVVTPDDRAVAKDLTEEKANEMASKDPNGDLYVVRQ